MRSHTNSGFSLVEFAIVTVVAGLVMVATMRLYDTYTSYRYAHDSYDKLKVLDSALAFYIGAYGRLPCPSNPTIPVTDPNAGREIAASSCTTLRNPLTPVGTCLDGVCKVDGARDTDVDVDVNPDPVMVGGVPFVELHDGGASLTGALDPWDYQFTYAVSGYLTDKNNYRASRGVIDVRTEPSTVYPRPGAADPLGVDLLRATQGGVSLLDPFGSSQYVVVAHGLNHKGAFSSGGKISVACGGTIDSDNCDNNPVVKTVASFTAGLRVDNKQVVAPCAPLSCNFDDLLVYKSFAMSSLWQFAGGISGDIYNLNPGFVGIGTSSPTQQLEVVGDLRATKVTAANLCDGVSGAECWSPDLLAAPAGSGSLFCPDTNTPGFTDVVKGITNDGAGKPIPICGLAPKVAPMLNQSCPALPTQQYVSGFDAAGNVVCYTP